MAVVDGQIVYAKDLLPVVAKATLSTAGPAISAANTWTQLSTFDTLVYDTANAIYGTGNLINIATGVTTFPATGKYRGILTFPWSSYGTAYARFLAFFRGLSATGTPLVNMRYDLAGYWWEQVVCEDVFTVGEQCTVWARTAASSSSGADPTASLASLTSLSWQKIG